MVEKRQQLAMTLAQRAAAAGRRSDPHRPGVREPAEQRRQVHRPPAATSRSRRRSRTARRSCSVRDDGTGMSAELLARAFDLFVQETRVVRPRPGRAGHRPDDGADAGEDARRIGAGASATARAAAASSSCGCRSRPRDSAAGDALRGAAAPDAVAAAPLRVLVVDDNVDAAHAMKHVLELSGHQVTLAHDGPGALAAAAAEAARAGAARHRAAGHGRLRGRGAAARSRA